MSDSEIAAPAETPVPAPCVAIKADLDKWISNQQKSTNPEKTGGRAGKIERGCICRYQ